jgi:serine/threonine-protein kinase
VAVGVIIDTRPAAGARIRKGGQVVLVPSLGPELKLVPDVRGLTENAAIKAIQNAGFTVGRTREYSDKVKEGRVIRQSPAPDVKVEKGRKVTIAISRGPAPVEVPSIKGMSAEVAKATLEAKGFEVNQTQEFSSTVAKGDAIRTDPPAGTEQPVGSEITLIVSKGPETVKMPNVVGMKTDAAITKLEGLGLHVKKHILGPFDGTVVKVQSPDPGTVLHVGDTVEIWV